MMGFVREFLRDRKVKKAILDVLQKHGELTRRELHNKMFYENRKRNLGLRFKRTRNGYLCYDVHDCLVDLLKKGKVEEKIFEENYEVKGVLRLRDN